MDSLAQLSEAQGYWILFGVVLLDVLGLPLTALPFLFIAGSLAATGTMSLPFIVVLATVAAAGGDTLWYALGRHGGPQVESLVNRLCGNKKAFLVGGIRFVKTFGIGFLIISKFIPGMASLACPAAGIANMPLPRFLVFDVLSRALWAACVSWIGYSWI